MSSSVGSSGSSSTRNRLTGLASGFDTQSMVEGLMALEKQPLDKLDIKKQTEELKLQAYQAVNTYLLKFRQSISTLSSRKLWNSKATTSSNEKSVTATANEYAVNGTYNFRVAQLATLTQYMSKGVSNSKAPLAPPVKDAEGKDGPAYKLGEINLSSAKTRVDNSAKLEVLNGGKGVYRGSVRITDGAGATAIVDLSGCDTVDDVVVALNDSAANINASIKDGALYIEDASNGTNGVRVQNVGAGTTATDLGIAGTSKPGENFIQGRNVYTMGEDTSLKLLNDGLGVEEGTVYFRVADGAGNSLTLEVDVDDCQTVGDIMKRVNAKFEEVAGANTYDQQGGLETDALKGLYFGISEDGTSFALQNTKGGLSYQFFDYKPNPLLVGNLTPADDLGLATGTHTVVADDDEVVFGRVLGGMNSPMVKNLNGATLDGVGRYGQGGENMLPCEFNENTPLSALFGGSNAKLTLPGLQIQVHEGGKTVTDLDSSKKRTFEQILTPDDINDFYTQNPEPTVGQLRDFVNKKINDYANDPANDAACLRGLNFQLDSEGAAYLTVNGAQAGYTYEIGGSAAKALGVERGYAYNTAVQKYTDKDSAASKTFEEAIKDFYNVGAPSLFQDNDSFGDLSEDAHTLKDLVYGLHGLNPEDYTTLDADGNTVLDDQAFDAAVEAWKTQVNNDGIATTLQNIFGGKMKITSSYPVGGGSFADVEVEVDFSQLFSGGGIDENTNVVQFMEEVNRVIADGFANSPQNDNGSGGKFVYSPPKLAVNATGNGLAWSNVDFTNLWKFEDVGGGTAVERLRLDKDTAVANPDDINPNTSQPRPMFAVQGEHAVPTNLDPRKPGFIDFHDVDETSAQTLTIGQLNLGNGLVFGSATDKMHIDLGDGNSIEFTYAELAAAMATQPSGGGQLNDLTIEDYVKSLNQVVGAKLADLNSTKSDPNHHVKFEFSIGKNSIQAGGFENVKEFKISGELADDYGVRTGITEGVIKEPEEGKEYTIGSLAAGDIYYQEDQAGAIEGLGEIAISLGNGDEYRLKTDGLDQESTLAELIAKLNSELDKLGNGYTDENGVFVPPEDEDFSKVRFTINDSGTGIAVENSSSKRVNFHDTTVEINGKKVSDAQYLGMDLGLVAADGSSTRVETHSFYNAKTLSRSMISRATKVEEYYPATKENGSIRITNSLGQTTEIDVNGCKTLGDILDVINDEAGHKLNVKAYINEKGDGITFVEDWGGKVPVYDGEPGKLSVADVDGGTIAKSFGMAGTGTSGHNAVFESSLNTTIEVMSTDTLESLMYRISSSGNYKCAIVNDGSANNPYRLTISSATTGESNDFVISSDIDALGFTQTSRAKDAKVLYGDPNSSASPVMLSSSTNSNSTAISGLTLDLKQSSTEWTTITVDTDKEKVKEEIKLMVESYNEMAGIISYLDAYDEETGEPGILFGDSSVRTLMDDINDYFYAIFNPNNVTIGSMDEDGKQATWSWMDLGVQLTAKQSNADGTGGWYTTMDLDLDALDNMVAANWDTLSVMLSGERNIANKDLGENVKASASFNGDLEEGFEAENAINGDYNKGSYGVANGIQAKGTIEEGNNEYTIWFQQPSTINRLSLYHYSSDTALKDFTVEYMDENGEWQTLREIEDNASDANHLGLALPTKAQAIRIKASSTNAEDGKFRLLDVQVFEQTGLAGKLNEHTTNLGDSQLGFLAERNNEVQANITDIKEQMERLQERLTSKEEALWRKFTAMEKALGSMQNQSSYFSSMMGSMNSNSK